MTSAPQTECTTEIAPDVARPQKRRKISNACEPCRARKTRCDGDRPTCGPCRYRPNSQRPCQYAKDAPKGVEQQDMTTRSLVERIQNLERVIASSRQHEHREGQQNQAIYQSTPPYSGYSEILHAESSHYIPSPEPPGQFVVHDVANPNPLQDVAQMEIPGSPSSPTTNRQRSIVAVSDEISGSPVNAMGSTAFMGTKLPLDAAGEFYGGSSAARFMQQAEEAIPDPGLKQSSIEQPGGSRWITASVPNSGAKALSLVLPTRDLADALLENYFAKSHSLYPFVYRPLFTSAYEGLWRPSHQLRRDTIECDLGLGTPGLSDSQSVVFHCALNAVFALSCQLSDPVIQQHDRESLSQTFFVRCRSLLHVDILDHGSIALVQTLLIVAQYLQSTSFPSRCWTSLGLACRIAQGVGLHVEDNSGPRRDAREVEVRRRVWYGCTLMDIVASATLGRPMMNPCRITIPLPSMTAEGESGELEDALSRSTFYVATIKLYLILGKILSLVYSPWPEADSERGKTGNSVKSGDMQAVISLDGELTLFEESVEACLHWERGINSRDSLPARIRYIVQRQANVLHARFLHARVLLHRPTFLHLCRKAAQAVHCTTSTTEDGSTVHHLQKERGFRSRMDMDSAVACVESTIQLVNSLDKSTTDLCDGAWWYTTFYLCTAGTVLVLARACLAMHKDFDIDEIRAAWKLCCGTLEKLATKGHPVQHALRGLCSLYQRLVGDSATQCSTTSRGGLDMEQAKQAPLRTEHHIVTDPLLQPESPQDRRQPQLQHEDIAQDTGSTATNAQPLMDFMTQNINLVPFGLIDEEWWRLQRGDWDLDLSD